MWGSTSGSLCRVPHQVPAARQPADLRRHRLCGSRPCRRLPSLVGVWSCDQGARAPSTASRWRPGVSWPRRVAVTGSRARGRPWAGWRPGLPHPGPRARRHRGCRPAPGRATVCWSGWSRWSRCWWLVVGLAARPAVRLAVRLAVSRQAAAGRRVGALRSSALAQQGRPLHQRLGWALTSPPERGPERARGRLVMPAEVRARSAALGRGVQQVQALQVAGWATLAAPDRPRSGPALRHRAAGR